MIDVERVARYMAAKKMGLVKDPCGLRLPDDLWSQYEDRARGMLAISPIEHVMEVIDLMTEVA